MMIFTACAMAFAHGSNDVANGIGPMAAIVSVIEAAREGAEEIVRQESPLPLWTLILGGAGLVIGLATQEMFEAGAIDLEAAITVASDAVVAYLMP